MGKSIQKDFNEIEEQFNLVFILHSSKASLAKEIDTRRQKPDEAVSNFIVDMRLLCVDYAEDMPEEEIVDKIKARVLPSFEPNLTPGPTNNNRANAYMHPTGGGHEKKDEDN